MNFVIPRFLPRTTERPCYLNACCYTELLRNNDRKRKCEFSGDISICVNIFHLLLVESLGGRSPEIQKAKGIWFSSVSGWRCPTAQELTSMSCYILPRSKPQLTPFLLHRQIPPTVPVFVVNARLPGGRSSAVLHSISVLATL